MANKYDVRRDPEVQGLLAKLPKSRYVPLVGSADLREVAKVLPAIAGLDFPINSAGELIEKLGGADKQFAIEGTPVDPLRMIKYMPAYYFPIASMENLVEKLAELVRANRKKVDVQAELASLRRQLPNLKFPIGNAKELVKAVSAHGRHVTFQGGVVDVEKIMERVPSNIFPITSQNDFEGKVGALMASRPLIEKD